MKRLLTRSMGFYLNSLALVSPQLAAKKGFELFCRPFRAPIKPWHKQFLHSADLFEFQHENYRIQGYRWGNGEKKILLLHGWQSHTYRWKAFVESFQWEEYSIYAFDAPGHGLSTGNFLSVPLYSDVIEQVIHRIGDLYAIIGHSLGSFTSIYTYYRLEGFPVAKLIALASPAEATEFFQFYQHTLKLSAKTIQATIAHFKREFQKGPEFFSAPSFARSVNVPGLIIHDQDDDETPVENSIRINQAWEQSTLLITKGLGHKLKGSAVLKHVNEFMLDGHSESTRTASNH
ncbi:alpha/beta hydrolase [Parapedobacter tibetensis]|uniref:alpha/beta hydrolase n=1 Tax=Parapedobacter tibetensis TaxID=2972951 RepID=UPI00214D41BF|nr:alpha/beta hydrolase [Parapedobacter tibetensis]